MDVVKLARARLQKRDRGLLGAGGFMNDFEPGVKVAHAIVLVVQASNDIEQEPELGAPGWLREQPV